MLILIVAGVPLFAQVQAVVQEANGKVELRPEGGSWRPAAVGATLSQGTTISTGFNSTAVLAVGSAVLEVKPLTRMQLQELIQREGTVSTGLFLRVGRVRAEVKSVAGLKQDFTLKSPVSTAAVRGTEFEFDGVTVSVVNGVVRFSNRLDQTRSVGGGQESSTTETGPPSSTEEQKASRTQVVTSAGPEVPRPVEVLKPATVTITVVWP